MKYQGKQATNKTLGNMTLVTNYLKGWDTVHNFSN